MFLHPIALAGAASLFEFPELAEGRLADSGNRRVEADIRSCMASEGLSALVGHPSANLRRPNRKNRSHSVGGELTQERPAGGRRRLQLGGYEALHRRDDLRFERAAACAFGDDLAERRKDEAERPAGRRAALAPVGVVIRVPGGAAQPVQNVIAVGDGMDGPRPNRLGEGAGGKQGRILRPKAVQLARRVDHVALMADRRPLQSADEHGEPTVDSGERE